jgi:predicted NAD-dependent protein-ADP-ribosyltransferase YbiA (DUF1768 family)
MVEKVVLLNRIRTKFKKNRAFKDFLLQTGSNNIAESRSAAEGYD